MVAERRRRCCWHVDMQVAVMVTVPRLILSLRPPFPWTHSAVGQSIGNGQCLVSTCNLASIEMVTSSGSHFHRVIVA
eukprot:3354421-Pleurochrysis_carterae.AAC.1